MGHTMRGCVEGTLLLLWGKREAYGFFSHDDSNGGTAKAPVLWWLAMFTGQQPHAVQCSLTFCAVINTSVCLALSGHREQKQMNSTRTASLGALCNHLLSLTLRARRSCPCGPGFQRD